MSHGFLKSRVMTSNVSYGMLRNQNTGHEMTFESGQQHDARQSEVRYHSSSVGKDAYPGGNNFVNDDNFVGKTHITSFKSP